MAKIKRLVWCAVALSLVFFTFRTFYLLSGRFPVGAPGLRDSAGAAQEGGAATDKGEATLASLHAANLKLEDEHAANLKLQDELSTLKSTMAAASLKAAPPKASEAPQSASAAKSSAIAPGGDSPDVIYLVTSCCSRFCDWQSIVALNSLNKLGVRSLRLISCDVAEGRALSPASHFSPFFVASHGKDNMPGSDGFYPPLSKSRSLLQWLGTPEAMAIPAGQNIALVDEDFLMLEKLPALAQEGKPVAQSWKDTYESSKYLRNGLADAHCRGACKGLSPEQARLFEVNGQGPRARPAACPAAPLHRPTCSPYPEP
jgi:hypothetical protein